MRLIGLTRRLAVGLTAMLLVVALESGARATGEPTPWPASWGCTNGSTVCLTVQNGSGTAIKGVSLGGIGTAGDGVTFGTFGTSVNGVGAGGSSTNYDGAIFSGGQDGVQALTTGSGSGIWMRTSGGSGWGFTSSGNGYVVGTVTQTSDRRAKTEIRDLAEPLVLKLQARSFKWINKDIGGDADGNDVGFIAQEVQQVMPAAVRYNKQTDTLGVNYAAVTPHLVKFAQDEHAARLAAEAKLKALEDRVAKLEAAVNP